MHSMHEALDLIFNTTERNKTSDPGRNVCLLPEVRALLGALSQLVRMATESPEALWEGYVRTAA